MWDGGVNGMIAAMVSRMGRRKIDYRRKGGSRRERIESIVVRRAVGEEVVAKEKSSDGWFQFSTLLR